MWLAKRRDRTRGSLSANPSPHSTTGAHWLLLILALWALTQAFRSSLPAPGIDFYQFWAVGRTIARHESADIYSERGRAQLGMRFFVESRHSRSVAERTVAEQRLVFETTATPFLYSVFGQLTSEDYASDLRAHRVALVTCFALSVIMLARLLEYGTTNALVVLALLGSCFEPLFSDLRVGNVGCLQLFGVTLYALFRTKAQTNVHRFLVGLWMGALVAFKPNLIFASACSLYASWRERGFRAFVHEASGLAAGGGLAIVYTSLQFGGIRIWMDWLAAIRNVPDRNITMSFGNYSPTMALGAWTHGFAPVALALTLMGAAAAGWVLRAGRDRAPSPRGPRRMIWWLAVGCLGTVVLPRLAWLHYFVLLVPALLVAMGGLARPLESTRAIVRFAITIAAWVGLCVNLLAASGAPYTNATYGVLMISATYLLIAATVAAQDESMPFAATPREGPTAGSSGPPDTSTPSAKA